jgi:hypothetical protein
VILATTPLGKNKMESDNTKAKMERKIGGIRRVGRENRIRRKGTREISSQ